MQRPYIEDKKFRIFLLACAFIVGFLLVRYCSEYILRCLTDNAVARGYFILPMFSLPIVFVLWWFRTHDTRQQIAKSQAQIDQSNFVAGMPDLLSGEPLKIEIGVRILLGISKNTNEFDAIIKLAFIKRLKEFPSGVGKFSGNNRSKKSDYKLPYAQHIIKWLKKNSDAGSLDLNNLNLMHQDFTSKDTSIAYADVCNLHDSKKYGKEPNIMMYNCYFTDKDAFFEGHADRHTKYINDNNRAGALD